MNVQQAIRLGFLAAAAGIGGAVLNASAAMALVSMDKWALLLVPGRYGVAVCLALMLPVLARLLPRPLFWIAGFAALDLGASLLAKLVFGAAAPWDLVLMLNAVYAAGAVAIYGVLDPEISPRTRRDA